MLNSIDDVLRSAGISTKNISNNNNFTISLSSVYQGIHLRSQEGCTYLINSTFPPNYKHGNIKIKNGINKEIFQIHNFNPPDKNTNMQKVLFLDIETTGLDRGVGTYSFLIGLGSIGESTITISQILLPDPSQESSFLNLLERYISSFDVIVTFNGNTYDIPFLISRFMLHGINTSLIKKSKIDLLSLSRKIWRNIISNKSLNNLEKTLLDFNRNVIDIPGWKIPDIYMDYLKTGNPKFLNGIIYHNKMDILSMFALFNTIEEKIINSINLKNDNGLELLNISQIYKNDARNHIYIDLLNKSLKSDVSIENKSQAYLIYAKNMKNSQNWTKAVDLWLKASEMDNIDAHIELAKYYEHKEKNYKTALYWSQKALSLLNTSNTLIYFRNKLKYLNSIEYRITRLNKKIFRYKK